MLFYFWTLNTAMTSYHDYTLQQIKKMAWEFGVKPTDKWGKQRNKLSLWRGMLAKRRCAAPSSATNRFCTHGFKTRTAPSFQKSYTLRSTPARTQKLTVKKVCNFSDGTSISWNVTGAPGLYDSRTETIGPLDQKHYSVMAFPRKVTVTMYLGLAVDYPISFAVKGTVGQVLATLMLVFKSRCPPAARTDYSSTGDNTIGAWLGGHCWYEGIYKQGSKHIVAFGS